MRPGRAAEARVTSIWEQRALDPAAILLGERVAVVTGAARGIGAGTAIALARFGAGGTLRVDGDTDAAGGWKRLTDGGFAL
jgi:hypothetical protein